MNKEKLSVQGEAIEASTQRMLEAELFLISMENAPRKQDGVEFWNIEDFLRRLWKGQIL